MRSRLRLGLCLFTITLIISSAAAAAQNVDVTGIVKDTSGAVLPGATIDATVAGLSVATRSTGPRWTVSDRARDRTRCISCARG